MNFTQKEIKTIATQRSQKHHIKILIIFSVLAVNLLGLILLVSYINGTYPAQPIEKLYVLDNNSVEIVGDRVMINGQEAQLQNVTKHEAPTNIITYPPIVLLLIGLLYYWMKTKREADRLMYEWAREGKDGGK